MPWCRAVVTAAMALTLPLAVAGCGGGTSPAASTTRGVPGKGAPSELTVSAADFCNNLEDLNSTAQAVGLDKTLADVRSDLVKSTVRARAVLQDGVPKGSTVGPIVVHLVGDLETMSTWATSRATQAQLDSGDVPPSVKEALGDMGFDFRYLQRWSDANCKTQQQGDGR